MHIVLCNCPPDKGIEIANALVKEGLAACVNIIPAIQSVYLWDGEVCDETEATLLIKVAAERVSALRTRILALHPYDVPEVLVLPVDTDLSHGPYVEWVRGQS